MTRLFEAIDRAPADGVYLAVAALLIGVAFADRLVAWRLR